MKEAEQNMMCALLQALLDKELITREVQEKAREKILGTFDMGEFFCYAEEKRKEDDHGYS